MQKTYTYPRYDYRQSDEQRAEALMKSAKEDAAKRWSLYRQMAAIQYGNPEEK